jgi:hypothetical protein
MISMLSICGFYEDRYGENSALLKDVNEILSIFSALFDLDQVLYQKCPQSLFRDYKFNENVSQ